MDLKPLKPKEKREILRKRLDKVLPQLPEKWINLFIHLNPEYKDQMVHLNNVRNKMSLDEGVIEKMESIAEGLSKMKGGAHES
jgi:hypothetical protein